MCRMLAPAAGMPMSIAPMTGQSNPPPDPSGASTQNAQYTQSVTYPSSQQPGIATGSSIRNREQRAARRPAAATHRGRTDSASSSAASCSMSYPAVGQPLNGSRLSGDWAAGSDGIPPTDADLRPRMCRRCVTATIHALRAASRSRSARRRSLSCRHWSLPTADGLAELAFARYRSGTPGLRSPDRP